MYTDIYLVYEDLMDSKIDFVQENTKKTLFIMYMPMLVGAVLNISYNLVDSLWIGNILGKNALAALGNSTPIVFLLTAIGMGATNAVAITLSQAVGKKDKDETNQIISTSAIYALLFAIVVTIIVELSVEPILKLLNTQPEVFKMAKDYLKVYVLGYIAVYLYFYFTAVLRSFGNTTFQAIALLICTIMNIIFDPIFINLFGFIGAAIATLISQCVALLIMICYIYKKKWVEFHISLLKFNCAKLLTYHAIPSMVQQSLPSVSTGVLTSLVNGFGITAMASYGIAGKVETILFAPAMVLNMVLTSITGQCFGAKRIDRVRDYIKCALIYSSIAMGILSGIVTFFSGSLSMLFLDNVDVSNIVRQYFIILCVGYVLNVETNCFLASINGYGKPIFGMIIMICYYLIIRAPLAYCLSKTSLGLVGIWIAVMISHIVAVGLSALVVKKIVKN